MHIFIKKILNQIKILTAKQPILAILIALILIFSLSTPDIFLSLFNIQNLFRQASFDGIVALGMTLVLIGGGVDLSVGMVMAMSAALTIGLQPYGVVFAVLTALLFGVVVGIINGFLVTKVKIVAFITTLGMMNCIGGLLLLYTRQQPISGQIAWFSDIGSGSLWIIPYSALVYFIIAILLHIMLTYTRFGRNMYTAGENQEACTLAGIKSGKYIFFTFVFSGLFSSLAGVLLASRLNSASIHIGGDTPLLVIAASIMGGASIFGGRGSVLGTFLGVLCLQTLSNGMNLLGVFTYYQYTIKALILITVVIVDAYYRSQPKQRSLKRFNKEMKSGVVAGSNL